MKNIHILPTENFNPLGQQIWRRKNGGLFKPTKSNPIANNLEGKVNIYITSDEKFVIDEYITDGIEVIKALPKLVDAQGLVSRRDWRKIILTTDQDLIKDGVWGIADEFLEWYVNNPACEYVELKGYAIVLPGESCDCDTMCNECEEEPKQETLEEAAERIAYNFEEPSFKAGVVYGIIEGAKWQQERMYSEEEVELIANEMVNWAIDNIGNPFPQSGKKFDEVIAKFKTKEDMKQETLEYDLLQHIKFCLECKNESQVIRLIEKYGFHKQERMYSEEELEVAFFEGRENNLPFNEWFEQFKNK